MSLTLCSQDCIGTNGQHLGVNCSDPYASNINGAQDTLGPRSEVNPSTGFFPYPFTGAGEYGDQVFRRLKVHKDDLDPALNAGAIYFVEGHYITSDDAAAERDDNNASWRPINVSPTTYNITVTESTRQTEDAIAAWAEYQPTLLTTTIPVVNDGLLIIGGDTFDNGDGTRTYIYAVHNLNSDRGVRKFEIPIPPNATITNIYFNDTDSHSGEPYDTTDWDAFVDYPRSRVVWQTQTFDENPNANALRWGTVYTFGFDIDTTDVIDALVDMELFKPQAFPGDPDTVTTRTALPTPAVCDFDGLCERGETCSNCATDCTTVGAGGFCGDLICDPGDSEDCLNCPTDCNGLQSGPDLMQYCCAEGGGTHPAFCIDPRCNDQGVTCMTLAGALDCCGDGICSSGEDSCQCAADCGSPPLTEQTCNDSEDNDCDGNIDCDDIDCCTDTLCTTGVDNDNDGVSDCDCDDADPNIWGTPSEPGTILVDDVSGATLSWTPPASPGATTVEYETLRTGLVEVFQYTTACLADGTPFDLSVSDGEDPVSGGVFYYLVRATNDCPGADGIGSLGPPGSDRIAPACP